MKKTISINISGIIFHIEEDGYEKLRDYLSGIGRYFATYEDSQEIIADIEARIAEIFLGKVNAGKQVITVEDVDTLIVTMGNTSDFEAVEEEESLYSRSRYAGRSGGATATATLPPPVTTSPRKLFRDFNRKLVGGVASGIANYFRVDPLWIRLLFLATLLDLFALPGSLSGPTFIAYIILWIVVPGTYVSPEEDQKVKKLYRDPDTRVIGGVSAGIAAFFGIDVTVVRLLFVLSIFFFGTGVLLYFILWAITPEARTLTERMRMQGEPVTLSNIESNIKKSLREDDSREESLLVRILLFPFRVIAAIFSAITRALAPIALFLLEAIRVAAGLLLVVIAVSLFFALLTVLGSRATTSTCTWAISRWICCGRACRRPSSSPASSSC
jgi:phage shock protein PspC (stress-responsive transcriptional regulator)